MLRRLPGLRIYHGVLVLPLSSVTMASSRESTSALHRRPSERNLLIKWLPISGWCREGSSKNVDSNEQLGCLPRPASELNEKNGVGCCLQLRWPISPLASDAYFRGFRAGGPSDINMWLVTPVTGVVTERNEFH